MNFTEKYRPVYKEEWVGIITPVNQATHHIGKHLEGNPIFRTILLVGVRGTGKTTLAFLVARHFGLNLIEVNASDERKKEDMIRIWKAAQTSSLDGRKNLILLDEGDGLTKSMQTKIVKLCKNSPTPIIICANDEFKIIREIRDISLKITFDKPSKEYINELLTKVCQVEGIVLPRTLIQTIAIKCTDYRSALNMLSLVMLDESAEGLLNDRIIGSLSDQIMDTLKGRPPDFYGAEPYTLANWMIGNTMDADLVADADLMVEYSKSNYRFWRYGYEILKCCRNPRSVKLNTPMWVRKGTQNDYSCKSQREQNRPRRSQKSDSHTSKTRTAADDKSSEQNKPHRAISQARSLSDFF